MEIAQAIAYVQQWREQQNLDPLSPHEEREAAAKLIKEKGYNLPSFIPGNDGTLQLKDGVYMETQEKPVLIVHTTEQAPEGLFPWRALDDREFWCEKLKSFVRMTGDLNADGTYFVIKSGEGNFRRYPVKGSDLVLKADAPKEAPTSDLLLVNSASWGDIKNCLITKFIPSYPWSKKGDRSPAEIREEMLSLAKSRRNGLASFIEEERKLGNFEDAQNFVLRMNAVHESFPWNDFTQMLDFNLCP